MMKIFDKSMKDEMLKVADGEKYIFEFVDCGHVYQDVCINVGGFQFFETNSCYHDTKSGAALECFCCYDENNDYLVAVVNLDGNPLKSGSAAHDILFIDKPKRKNENK